MLLDALDRSTQRRSPSHRLRNINRPGIKPYRVQAGEPPHRPRQINIGKNLLPAVTFQIDKHRRPARPTAPPAPVRNRNHQAAQQHIVDAAMKRRRDLRQQRSRQRRRQLHRQMPRRPRCVAPPIQLAIKQAHRPSAQHPKPLRKLRLPPSRLRLLHKPPPPPPIRGPARRKLRQSSRRYRRPTRRKVRYQYPPRHPVHRQMMNAHQHHPGRRRAHRPPRQPPRRRKELTDAHRQTRSRPAPPFAACHASEHISAPANAAAGATDAASSIPHHSPSHSSFPPKRNGHAMTATMRRTFPAGPPITPETAP